MVVLRLIGVLALIAVGAALGLYLFTRNRRFLTFAWRIFQFTVIFAVVLTAIYALERLLLVA